MSITALIILLVIFIIIGVIAVIVAINIQKVIDFIKSLIPFKYLSPGEVCATNSQCDSNICKGGRCMSSSGTLPPGSSCTVGPAGRYCPEGYYCGGIPVECRENDPDGKDPGESCAVDADCKYGNCIIAGLNECADENGKLPSGSYCLGPSVCSEYCASGSGTYTFPAYYCD